jgi:hypothetical protein
VLPVKPVVERTLELSYEYGCPQSDYRASFLRPFHLKSYHGCVAVQVTGADHFQCFCGLSTTRSVIVCYDPDAEGLVPQGASSISQDATALPRSFPLLSSGLTTTRPNRQKSRALSVFDLVQLPFQSHGVLLCRGTSDCDWQSAGEILMLDLSRPPGEAAPNLFVVIDLDRQ